MTVSVATPALSTERPRANRKLVSVNPEAATQANAVVFNGQRRLDVRLLDLVAPGPDDLVVDILWSGVSTGTERLFWTGDMPPFPGLSYPLVPGYESVGIVRGGPLDGRTVFVPGASCFKSAAGLFGATASRLIVPRDRVQVLEGEPKPEFALLALAATAYHAVAGPVLPDLVIGHGVLGRLASRLIQALGGDPTVWESNPKRRGQEPYPVITAEDDTNTAYRQIVDMSGSTAVIDTAVSHAAKGAELVLAGFYMDRPSFAFPPAFMKEMKFRVAAEWAEDDMKQVLDLVVSGRLSLEGLITHSEPASNAAAAYETAFGDPRCLKMIIDWSSCHGHTD